MSLDTMQDNAAAFEGWSVVLMTWCGVRRLVIDWDEPNDTANGHYQRFLYRLRHFEALLGPDVAGIEQRERLARCRVARGSVATLNLAGATAMAETPSLPGSVADLEKRLAGANQAERDRLMATVTGRLDRQMPVGVFDGPPSRARAIFTGGKSAIDLVGPRRRRRRYGYWS